MDAVISCTAQYLIYVVALIVFGLWVCLPKPEKLRFAVGFIVAGILATILSKFIAHFYYDTRPFVVLHRVPLFPHVADNGFPSDHTTVTMIVALLWFGYSRRIAIGLIICSLIIGIARVESLVHSPIDIIGSVLIAMVSTFIAFQITKNWCPPFCSD